MNPGKKKLAFIQFLILCSLAIMITDVTVTL